MVMEPDPNVAYEMRKRAEMGVPRVPIKDPQISDVYREVRIIRKWVIFIGIVVIIALVGVVISLLGLA